MTTQLQMAARRKQGFDDSLRTQKANAANRKWRAENPEKMKASRRQWAKNNPDQILKNLKAWQQRNPEKVRASQYRIKYGITIEQYDHLLAQQKGGCAICHKKPKGRRLAIDHSRITKHVRGLLCTNCNIGIGTFYENPDYMTRAMAYLQLTPPLLFVPPQKPLGTDCGIDPFE